MPNTSDYLLVFTSCASQEDANEIARTLVEKQLAACVQILPKVTSFYAWQDQLCQEEEISLQIKCLAINYKKLEKLVMEIHPYEVPELIAVSIDRGLPAYLHWIKENS